MPSPAYALHHPFFSWYSLSWFGDTALLLPAGLALGIALLLRSESRGLALRWALAFGTTGLLAMSTKIAFMGWGIGSAALDFTGLSGHSALSAAFWPVAGWMGTQRRSVALRTTAIGLGVLLALAIGVSRLALGVHSFSEVVLGLLVGGGTSFWFISGIKRDPPRRTTFAPAVLIVIALIAVLQHGRPAPTTALLETTVIRVLGVSKPFTRQDLHLRQS